MKVRVSAEDFVRAWQTSTSINEVMEKTGLKYWAANSRATTLRKRGIPLKNMHYNSGRKKMDIEALKRLATELLNETEGNGSA